MCCCRSRNDQFNELGEKIMSKWKFWKFVPPLGGTLAVVLVLRLGIYQWLHTHGYFYGIPWDSFMRTQIAYNWSREPFFAPPDGYWLPLQFYLVGSVFALIRPWLPTSEILVPVAINNIFFIASIVVLFFLTLELSQEPLVAGAACVLASVFAGDVFVSYTALSEPMLIFFMLLASFLFYKMHTGEGEDHPRKALITAFVVLLAAASHYIGWFLAIFFCLYFGYHFAIGLIRRNYPSAGYYFLAIAVCALVPIAWLFVNYLMYGDPFSPLQVARHAQEDYIGTMEVLERILIIPNVILYEFFPIVVPGLLAGVFLFFKTRRTLVYLIPMGFVLGWLWLSTALAFSAPYQEPRYLVFVGWALLPLIAIAGRRLWNAWGVWGKALTTGLCTVILFFNMQQIGSFRNSFEEYVRTTAMQARYWLAKEPESARVFLFQEFPVEAGVIPVISGSPERIVTVSEDEIIKVLPNLQEFFNSKARPWLFITREKVLADEAKRQHLFVRRTGKYFLISDQPF